MRLAIIIGRQGGEWITVGNPYVDPRVARDEYHRLIENPAELEHIELWTSDGGRVKRQTINAGVPVKSQAGLKFGSGFPAALAAKLGAAQQTEPDSEPSPDGPAPESGTPEPNAEGDTDESPESALGAPAETDPVQTSGQPEPDSSPGRAAKRAARAAAKTK